MPVSKSNERLVFDYHTLRLIIGALAFAFPAMVCALTGRITTSISASYHEVQSRNVFVGFLFILGALLVSYKGHRRMVPNRDGSKLWVLARRYEEDWISAVGGVAAILTALCPTARDGYPMDTKAVIHTVGAFILFASVVYFCLIAFLHSLNEKLLGYAELNENNDLIKTINEIKSVQEQKDVNLIRRFIHFLTSETLIFCRIVSEVSRQYDEGHRLQRGKISFSDRRTKLKDLWSAYGKKITRGWVYVVCGWLITLVLLGFLLTGLLLPGLMTHSKITFAVETIALVFFGVAWMTASQSRYIRKIQLFLALRRPKSSLVAEPSTA